MKRILILDDDPDRHRTIQGLLESRLHEPFTTYHVWTVQELREAFYPIQRKPSFDLVLLDHDLGEDPEIGVDAADFLTHLPQRMWPAQTIIHSWNIPGAKAMYDRIRRAGLPVVLRPFSLTMFE
jgi:CheY-like chemotaxis protein